MKYILTGIFLFALFSVSVTANGNETVNTTMNLTGNIPTSTIFFAEAGEPDDGSISLTPNSTTTLSCSGVADDLDGLSDLTNLSSVIYANSSSRFDADNESLHYTNSSCDLTNFNVDGSWNCTYQVQYYAEPSDWTCAVNITNSDPQYYNDTINTSSTIEDLVALSIHNSSVDFGLRAVDTNYSADTEVRVYNEGNVVLDLLLDAFNDTSTFVDDSDQAFSCDISYIPIDYLRFSLVEDDSYLNGVPMQTAGSTAAQPLGLSPQVGGNDDLPTFSSTYWAPAIPLNVAGSCTGRLMYIGSAA